MGLTRKEKQFSRVYAAAGSLTEAARKAGYVDHTGGVKALRKPEVQAEIAREQTARLFNEVLPLAIQVHLDLLASPTTPAGAKVQAVKLAYDRTLGVEGAEKTKDPHEMSPDELAKELAQARLRAAALESVKADRARPVLEGETVAPADVFE